jgi:ATP-dependent DNA ligase
MPRFSPMLASTGPMTGTMKDWAFEPKLDGGRALVYVDGSLMVRTRNDGDITSSLPELSPLAREPAGRHVVLDGELVAQQGRPFDFYRIGPRLAHLPGRRSARSGSGRCRWSPTRSLRAPDGL